MQSGIVTGNAEADGTAHRGWFLGHFIQPEDDPRFTAAVELKWVTYAAGEARSQWALNREATSLSLLVQGRFRIQFPEGDVVLSQVGDYALWLPGIPHCWRAEAASTILTVRYPSEPGDSVEQVQEGFSV